MTSRYLLVHKLLPGFAFDNKAMTLEFLKRENNLMEQFVQFCWKQAKEILEEDEELFESQTWIEKFNNEIKITIIKPPTPTQELEALYIAYMSSPNEFQRYFVLEIGAGGIGHVCEWNEQKSHINYGTLEENTLEAFIIVLKNISI